jgi:hypothetical protein
MGWQRTDVSLSGVNALAPFLFLQSRVVGMVPPVEEKRREALLARPPGIASTDTREAQSSLPEGVQSGVNTA